MRWAIAATLLPMLGCGGAVDQPTGGATLAIVGATLIDGTGAPPVADSLVLIEGGYITAVGRRGELDIPAGATQYDAAGRHAIPGLVDLHGHPGLGGSDALTDLTKYLNFGVTTVRSIGVDGPEIFELRALQRDGKIVAPRIYTAGQGFSIEGGWPPGPVLRPSSPARAREMVRALANKNVDWVKIWIDSKDGERPKIPPDMQEAIVEEASRYGIPVAAHIVERNDVEHLTRTGAVHFLHMIRDVDQLDSALIGLLLEKGVSFAPTLGKIEGDWYFAEHPEMLDDALYQASVNPSVIEQLREANGLLVAGETLDQRKTDFERAKRFVEQLFRAGVPIALGSDGGARPMGHGHAAHLELELLIRSGLTPLEAIQCATSVGARILEPDGEWFGSIAPGMAADLVLLAGDPLERPLNTLGIVGVLQAGRWIERSGSGVATPAP